MQTGIRGTPAIGTFQANRRSVLGQMLLCGAGLAASPLLGSVARAQGATPVAPTPLPLKLDTLYHHTGMSVEDVTASATFYSKLFGGNHVGGEMVASTNGQPPTARYFIHLDPGSVAIGKLGTLGSVGQTKPLIDHICVGAKDFDSNAWRERLKLEGLRYIASEVFLGIDDIPIQVAGGHGGEGLSAGTPAQLPVLYSGAPLVHCRGFDHVMLRVADPTAASAFWHKIFGIRELRRANGVIWMTDGNLQMGLRPLTGGEKPGYDYQAFRTAAFDHAKVAAGLARLAATVQSPRPYDARTWVRFSGPDGIEVVLVPS